MVTNLKLVSLGWGKQESETSERCNISLPKQFTLADRDFSIPLTVYSNASDCVWSGVVTQVPLTDIFENHDGQGHRPVLFLSGAVNSSQIGWNL